MNKKQKINQLRGNSENARKLNNDSNTKPKISPRKGPAKQQAIIQGFSCFHTTTSRLKHVFIYFKSFKEGWVPCQIQNCKSICEEKWLRWWRIERWYGECFQFPDIIWVNINPALCLGSYIKAQRYAHNAAFVCVCVKAQSGCQNKKDTNPAANRRKQG